MKWMVLMALLVPVLFVQAQPSRITDDNTVFWLSNQFTLRFHKKWSGHLEYQWRREGISEPQQNLWRGGINYELTEQVQLRLGYAYIDTYNYGDIPLQPAGRTFPEHRSFQMVSINNNIGRVQLTNRLMQEQRWVGRFLNPGSAKADDFVFTHRSRLMVRAQVPLNNPKMADRTWYLGGFNEIFISYGSRVGENIFDQNRLSLFAGYRFSPVVRIEGGFFQQRLQLGREVQSSNVFQNNSGLLLTSFFTFDLRRKK
jgi:hypothetical protein